MAVVALAPAGAAALDGPAGEAGALVMDAGPAGLLGAGVDEEASAGFGQRVIVLGIAVMRGFWLM